METFNQYRNIIISSVVLVALLVGGIWYARSGTVLHDEQTDVRAEGAKPIDLTGVTATSGPVKKDGYIIEMIPDAKKSAAQAPVLDRAIPEIPSFSAEARAALLANLTRVTTALRANSDSYGDWIELGALRQTVGDYVGAAQAWEYAAALSPTTGVAYANLGYLYASYVKDYPKAEAYYLKGIANDPRALNTYRNLFDLYQYSYKQGTSAAEDILKSGIAKLPQALDLRVLLARYYRDHARTADAVTAYDAAIAAAEKAGNTALAGELKTESASLR